MSERRFVIAEGETDMDRISGRNAITESELKRRVHDIRTIMYYNDDRAIDILLHGEGKEEPVPGPDEWPHVPFPKKPQPDPWEAWVEDMPYEHQQLGGYGIWYQEMQAWFRKMPRGK